jgi:hypothetical protein
MPHEAAGRQRRVISWPAQRRSNMEQFHAIRKPLNRLYSMFADGYKQCAQFLRPVIISQLNGAGQCGASIGSYIHVNDEGWIMTAAHIVELANGWGDHRTRLEAIDQEIDDLSASSKPASGKRKRIEQLRSEAATMVRLYDYWWAYDGAKLVDVAMIKEADIAVGRLEPFDRSMVPAYPTFKDPSKGVACGTAVCRLGYPFAEIAVSFANGRFEIPGDVYGLPRFPNEGIVTRQIMLGANPNFKVGFIETSTPGLKGQSGGPIFDANGTVWGIQSQTKHLSLGFSPQVPGSPSQMEHQFLNVGWGTHPDTIVGLMRQVGVKFTLSDY